MTNGSAMIQLSPLDRWGPLRAHRAWCRISVRCGRAIRALAAYARHETLRRFHSIHRAGEFLLAGGGHSFSCVDGHGG